MLIYVRFPFAVETGKLAFQRISFFLNYAIHCTKYPTFRVFGTAIATQKRQEVTPSGNKHKYHIKPMNVSGLRKFEQKFTHIICR